MQVAEKRTYRQTRRAEATEATRQRILAAAQEQLTRGEDFTIDAVAKRAAVSRVTIYAQFGNRDALREAVFDHLGATGGLGQIPSIFATPDPIEAIGRLVDIFTRFYATHRVVLRRLNALAALAAAGAGERSPDRNDRRRKIITAVLTRATQLPEYRDLDVDITTTILQALTSFEFYDQLEPGLVGPTGSTGPARHIRALAAAALRTR